MESKEAYSNQNSFNQPPVLFRETQVILRQLEEKLNATILVYWTSPAGTICGSDVEALQEILRTIGPQKEVYLFIKSDGGSGLASLRLVNLIRHYFKSFKVLVPLDCASAATMIALGAEEIYMGPLAYLTAIDSSLTHKLSPLDAYNNLVSVSQDELMRVMNLWQEQTTEKAPHPYDVLFQYIHPLVIGAVDRASSLSIKICSEIMSYHLEDQELIESISHRLNSSYPSHSYPITFKEAKKIGLNIKPLPPEINSLLLEMHKLYSQMGQKAFTFINEFNYHNNEILNILECKDIQVHFKNDLDWHYRKEERRWVRMNDNSAWRRVEMKDGEIQEVIFHIR